MERSKLADLSEIVSSIAIIITLIYLIIEINQNTDAIRTQTAQSILQAGQAELAMMVENPDIPLNIPSTKALTPEQNVVLDAYFASHMRNREFAWLQYKNDTIDEGNWESELMVMSVWLDSHRFRIWWNKLGRYYSREEFTIFVDQLIEDAPPATDELWSTVLSWTSEE
jgi:hypothetical protein